MHGARARALAAFHQPGRAVAARAPQAAALPTRIRIVDTPVETLGVEAHGIRNAHQDHLAILQRHEPVVEVGGGNRNVLSKADRVVLIDPGVIARLDAPVLEAFKPRSGIFVEFPVIYVRNFFSACETAAVEECLFLRRCGAAKHGIPMRKAAESTNDIGM